MHVTVILLALLAAPPMAMLLYSCRDYGIFYWMRYGHLWHSVLEAEQEAVEEGVAT